MLRRAVTRKAELERTGDLITGCLSGERLWERAHEWAEPGTERIDHQDTEESEDEKPDMKHNSEKCNDSGVHIR